MSFGVVDLVAVSSQRLAGEHHTGGRNLGLTDSRLRNKADVV